jgi:hypothetical protein
MRRLALLAVLIGCCWSSGSFYSAGQEQVDRPLAERAGHRAPDGLLMRVRLKAITPTEPSEIHWRYGGEGQGGEVIRGVLPSPKSQDGKHLLAVGQWSEWVPVTSLVKGVFPGKLFLTFTAGRGGRIKDRITRELADYSTDVQFEFEFSYKDKPVKSFVEEGPHGGTVTIVIPAYRLVGQTTPESPEFLRELTGVLEYAQRRAEFLEGLPWAAWPLPKKYLLINNIGGYGKGHGYGVRTTNPAVTLTELRALRQLGVNGLRDAPSLLLEALRRGDPQVAAFRRGMEIGVMGFPVPRHRADRPPEPEAGCPFAPGVPQRTREAVEEALKTALSMPVEELWGLTVDEIGSVFDLAPEGKAHPATCPHCAAAFRQYLAAKGLSPKDFGKSTWEEVRPLDVTTTTGPRPWLADPGAALAAYYTRDFNNFATARLFTPLRQAFASANEAKRQALRSGSADRKTAEQPWLYSFALRGNTFLMRGHSLEFFDFYRHADNAIVYETSNREPRVWSWDSYLCDVQRVVGQTMGIARGIYIKPHRGAPVQRMLSAVSRGNTMIYWYTYGPDYTKGDSFSQSWETLALTSKAAHLLGKAEDVLYGSTWAVSAEIAVVKPETTQRWMNLCGESPHLTAAWENAKWVYTALQHAHLPVDPLDEALLLSDLSHYKIIYVNGSHITAAAASALRRYVEQGGTLYTSGWGLARDESNRPLEALQAVLGLQKRQEPQMWYQVQLYGATAIEGYDEPGRMLSPAPSDAMRTVKALVQTQPAQADKPSAAAMAGEFPLVVGREVLQPAASAEVIARFADGQPAVVRNRFGKGQAIVVGFYPGLEYSATVRRPDYNMRRDFDPARRSFVVAPALALTRPVVEISDPLVEGVLLQAPQGGAKAVTLANWAYGVTQWQSAAGKRAAVVAHLPIEDVKIRIRGAGSTRTVTSCMLDRQLEFSVDRDCLVVCLPRLEEGDVLLLQ